MATTLLNVKGLEKTSPAFRRKVVEIAGRLKLDPNWLTSVMAFESGFNPQAVNKYSGATGLIQWVGPTARQFGTSTDELLRMDALEQLDYVEKYFASFGGRIRRLQDAYFAVFCPALLGKPLSTIVARKGDSSKGLCGNSGRVYTQNSGFDSGGKGHITVADIATPVTSIYQSAGGTLPIGAGGGSVPWKLLGLGALVGVVLAWGTWTIQEDIEAEGG